jgi:hypothetical protein
VGSYAVACVVLAAAFVFAGVSFLQSRRKSRQAARRKRISVIEQLYRTTDPTARAIVLEDAAALIGIVIAAGAIIIHQVALLLIGRNRSFLVGEVADPDTRDYILGDLRCRPEVDRVTWLHLEVVGTDRLLVVASIGLAGEPAESEAARQLAAIDQSLRQELLIVVVVLSLSEPQARLVTHTDGTSAERGAGFPGSVVLEAGVAPLHDGARLLLLGQAVLCRASLAVALAGVLDVGTRVLGLIG